MIDEVFHYATRHNLISLPEQISQEVQGQAKCRVRVNHTTVIATEIRDNPGMSITNVVQEVAVQVSAYYEIPLSELVWIEHYPEEPSHEESFDRVQFSFERGRLTNPQWRRITREEAMSLLGDC